MEVSEERTEEESEDPSGNSGPVLSLQQARKTKRAELELRG